MTYKKETLPFRNHQIHSQLVLYDKTKENDTSAMNSTQVISPTKFLNKDESNLGVYELPSTRKKIIADEERQAIQNSINIEKNHFSPPKQMNNSSLLSLKFKLKFRELQGDSILENKLPCTSETYQNSKFRPVLLQNAINTKQ